MLQKYIFYDAISIYVKFFCINCGDIYYLVTILLHNRITTISFLLTSFKSSMSPRKGLKFCIYEIYLHQCCVYYVNWSLKKNKKYLGLTNNICNFLLKIEKWGIWIIIVYYNKKKIKYQILSQDNEIIIYINFKTLKNTDKKYMVVIVTNYL